MPILFHEYAEWLPVSLPMLHRLWFQLPADELDSFSKHHGSDGEWHGGLGGCDSYDLSGRALYPMLNAWAIWRIVVLGRCFAVNCAARAPVVSGGGRWLRNIS
ncbi:hypothetical protein SAMN02982917_2760 [Azospirillum oryzae]|uniref:Uncharacterized protein n=1 Tax=Azospirillum oryzae TaxID=286727 RepID=A0A1X7FFU1_9PROT|nr:hypothetical protein [Azospirillum oryzae]SMF51157.1 hypothetical protein SAMN02982917_2760 [Azospirillum oryzae]